MESTYWFLLRFWRLFDDKPVSVGSFLVFGSVVLVVVFFAEVVIRPTLAVARLPLLFGFEPPLAVLLQFPDLLAHLVGRVELGFELLHHVHVFPHLLRVLRFTI